MRVIFHVPWFAILQYAIRVIVRVPWIAILQFAEERRWKQQVIVVPNAISVEIAIDQDPVFARPESPGIQERYRYPGKAGRNLPILPTW